MPDEDNAVAISRPWHGQSAGLTSGEHPQPSGLGEVRCTTGSGWMKLVHAHLDLRVGNELSGGKTLQAVGMNIQRCRMSQANEF